MLRRGFLRYGWGSYNAVTIVAFVVLVFVSMGKISMGTDIMVTAVAFSVFVKIIMISKGAMTIAQEKTADVAFPVTIRIHTAKIAHTVDAAGPPVAAVASSIAVFIGMGKLIIIPSVSAEGVETTVITLFVIDTVIIIDIMFQSPDQSAHILTADIAQTVTVFVYMGVVSMVGATTAVFTAGIAGAVTIPVIQRKPFPADSAEGMVLSFPVTSLTAKRTHAAPIRNLMILQIQPAHGVTAMVAVAIPLFVPVQIIFPRAPVAFPVTIFVIMGKMMKFAAGQLTANITDMIRVRILKTAGSSA